MAERKVRDCDCVQGCQHFMYWGRTENGLGDSLGFTYSQSWTPEDLSFQYVIEQLHREIRRCTGVAGIFPNKEFYVRLGATYLMKYDLNRCFVRCAKNTCLTRFEKRMPLLESYLSGSRRSCNCYPGIPFDPFKYVSARMERF